LQSPLIVAGGLDASNIADAIATLRPWGVDVSSGVERTRGVKDPALIDAFCQAVRDCSPA
jgi:phosphoribosylanthranilate isomerase